MIMVGCDFHTRFQQVAMLDPTTGEVIERRLEHETGEARSFYASLCEPARVGIEAHRECAVVRESTPGISPRALGRRCGGDPRDEGTKAEDRLAGCPAHPRSASDRPISSDLDSVSGRARCPAIGAAST